MKTSVKRYFAHVLASVVGLYGAIYGVMGLVENNTWATIVGSILLGLYFVLLDIIKIKLANDHIEVEKI